MVKFATLSRSGGTQIPNSDTFSNSVDKARLNANNHAQKNISHANDGVLGPLVPLDPPLAVVNYKRKSVGSLQNNAASEASGNFFFVPPFMTFWE